jgi:hypothetical protein
MNAWFYIRTGAVWLFGAALILVGALLVLQQGALLVWQYSIALEKRAWPPLPLLMVFSDPSQLSAAAARLAEVIPKLRWDWLTDPANAANPLHMGVTALLNRVHIGAVPALLGVFIGLAGLRRALRQRDTLAAARRAKEDRLRRRRHYRSQIHGFRMEPEGFGTITAEGFGTVTDIVEASDTAWRRERVLGRRR